jgi:restriction system protein
VGVDRVREFAGSLVERGATKGVFVTTSHFAPAASAYAERIPQRLVLIDGDELTRLMVYYGVGVRTDRTIDLRKLDLDYFDEDAGVECAPGRPRPGVAPPVLAACRLGRGY